MITIGFSTRQDNPNYIEYVRKTSGFKNLQIIQKINNGDKSLGQVYNEILSESVNDIVVLIHDDLEFDTNRWGDKLLKVFNRNPDFGIIGLAGSKFLPKSCKWWEVQQTMYGIVNHKNDGKKWTSTYSRHINDKIEETIMVDGLFIAVNKNMIKHNFDESINGFHFYDLGFCVPNFLNNVKIGVTFNIRVTHLSIGQTNQEWEKNRILFSEKYKNELPLDITNTEKINQTFIFVHDQNIVTQFESNNKLKNLKNYKYVFLGNRDVNLIENNPNVIIARNLPQNIEQYPLFTSFTGWYALWKNNLINSDYISLFEYDTILSENIEQIQSKLFYDKTDMIGYVPFPVNNFQFIDNPDWVEHIFPAIKRVYNFDMYRFIKNLSLKNPKLLWSSTSNTTFQKDVFFEFMSWFEPLIDYIKDTRTCGHAHERAISFFYLSKNKKMSLTNGVLQHLQLDSHQTQGVYEDRKNQLENLINNG
jgi:hypothetical protein